MTTIPIQTRLSHTLAMALDARAKQAGTTRAEVVREMLETALAVAKPAQTPETDPLLNRICDELGAIAARVDASLAASRGAHAAAKLAGLMLLPADQQAAFIEKLSKAAQ